MNLQSLIHPTSVCNLCSRLLAGTALIALGMSGLLGAPQAHAQAQPECINPNAPAPLEICVNATGRHNVWLSDTGLRVPQYFGSSNYNSDWYVRARSNGQTRRFSGGYIYNSQTDLPTAPSGTQLIGAGTITQPYIIQSELTLGDTGLLLTQQLIHVNGERSFRKRWILQNVGSEAVTELNFFHGGDIDLGGNNTSRSWRDDNTGMLYATNQDTTTAGYMGTMPHPSTPPSHYYAGQYSQGFSAILSGNLPNIIDNDLIDAGYFLQWQRGALQPGHEWVIEAVEMFSQPGDLQVLPPPTQFLRPGQSTPVPVRLHNINDNQYFAPALVAQGLAWAAMTVPALGNPPGSPLPPLQSFSGQASLTVAPSTLLGEKGLITISSTSNSRTTNARIPVEVRDIRYTVPVQAPMGYADATSTRIATFTFTNMGEQVRLGYLDPQGDLGAEFSLAADSCSGQTLVTDGLCSITLRFQPTTSNAFSGELRWPILGPVLTHATSTVTANAGVALATVSATGNGTISPSMHTVPNQGTRQFTLTPQPHHHVQSATGCNGSLNGNVYTTGPVDRPCTVSVAFAPNLYTVDATAIGNGTVSPPSQVLMANQTASLTLTPAANHHVADISGCTGTLNNNTFTTDPITASCSVQATFALNSYSVTTASQGNGLISPSTASVVHGGTTTFTLTPAPNHHILNASGCNGSLNGSQYTTGPVTSACVVNASFELDHYQITASSTGNGSISPATLSVGHGQSAIFTLTPADGYGIAGVSGCNGSLSGNEYTIDLVNQACVIQADFTATQPTFTTDLNQPLDIDATGLLTALPQDAHPQATDALGNALQVTLLTEQTHFLPGRHELQWRAVDEAGRSVTATQVLQVWPIVALGPNVWMGQRRGDVASFKVVLNGAAPVYPYDVAYRVDGVGAEHDLRSGTVRFENGQTEQDVFVAITAEPAPNTPARATTVTLENTRNIGTRDALTVYMNPHNLPPVAQVRALRANQDGSSFDRHGGAITLVAEVTDPNTQDTHSYLWSIPSQAAVTDHGASLVLEPATMEPGIHRFQVQITDDGAPAMSITAALDLVITETPVALPPGAAGWLPSALPAHANYALPMSNVLPAATSEFQQHLLEAAPGLQLRLGATAIQEAAHQAQLADAALPADTVANIGGYFDFQLSGLNSPGNLATVVIPQRTPVPERAVYRKFDTDKQLWHSFVQDTLNQIASAPGAPGICPPPHSTEYRPGLTQGDWCVRLTLEDGGPNDSDGAPNGVIADPGGVGQADVVSVASPATRSGRGSLGWMTLGMFAMLLCARRAAMSHSR